MNGKRIVPIIFIGCLIYTVLFSLSALAFVTQGTLKWGKDFHKHTRQGSMHFLAATSSAISAFSSIDEPNMKMAIFHMNAALKVWKSSLESYEKATESKKALQMADPWVIQNAAKVIRKWNLSPDYGIGKEIMDSISRDGAKGLLKMTIGSIGFLQKQISITVKKIEAQKPPSYEQLLETLRSITIELYKGLAISEVFYQP